MYFVGNQLYFYVYVIQVKLLGQRNTFSIVFNVSIFPLRLSIVYMYFSVMKQDESKVVVPGEDILPCSSDVRPGKGCYELHNYIRASLPGYVFIKEEHVVCIVLFFFLKKILRKTK